MKMIVEPVTAFLDRVNMLEGFKHLGITLFDLKFDSTEELYNLATGYIYEDPNCNIEYFDYDGVRHNFGPINGQYFHPKEAEQINTAYAIKTDDIEYLKERMFNVDSLSMGKLYSTMLYSNMSLFGFCLTFRQVVNHSTRAYVGYSPNRTR